MKLGREGPGFLIVMSVAFRSGCVFCYWTAPVQVAKYNSSLLRHCVYSVLFGKNCCLRFFFFFSHTQNLSDKTALLRLTQRNCNDHKYPKHSGECFLLSSHSPVGYYLTFPLLLYKAMHVYSKMCLLLLLIY